MNSTGKTYPVFSIITPTFRRPKLLSRNIRSVLCQTYGKFEHIIVDDGNDPATDRIVGSFNDERLILVKHDQPRGAAAAYNTGIKLSRGSFITFLDDDDEYLPHFLEKVNDFFNSANNETGFVWSGISFVKDTGDNEKIISSRIWPSSFKTREEGLVAATTIGNGYGLCIRKECIQKIGMYDESYTLGQDADFLFKLVRHFNFATISSILVRIHHHDRPQLTDLKNNKERLRLREMILLKHYDLMLQYPSLYSIHYKHIAYLSYGLKLKKNGRNAMVGVLKHQPYFLKNYLDFISYELTGKDFSSVIHLRLNRKTRVAI